ncbi:hypothetical protein VIGAN_07149200 [Vigna angularis var. angularis]|uniref:Uncharacterized protein n=1 Tax=Vigna angularis var. angularis TaxID=157739 RepID=A0A0S3SIP7_PHAAN|nr:hypothetical protein VIGAN_07149200 [Vigna angularis var. angularis]
MFVQHQAAVTAWDEAKNVGKHTTHCHRSTRDLVFLSFEMGSTVMTAHRRKASSSSCHTHPTATLSRRHIQQQRRRYSTVKHGRCTT